MSRRYPDGYRERARALYRRGEYGVRRVAADLGVPAKTVRSWVNDDYAERSRVSSRRCKQRYRGVCVDCGKSTSYNGVDTHGAKRCLACSSAWWQAPEQRAARTKWPRERIVERIREWNDMYGTPPTAKDWNPWAARFELGHEERAQRFLLADGHWPWFTVVARRFGTWNTAIEAAGFEANEPSGAAKRWNTDNRVRRTP